ncbi:hypothetical protein [Nocardioides stalactiti]|uniref:hypothetical protein n=1 Tax=Nocardioides stalactiti TaxID=2755356 RepID=UPI0016039FD8|nr:hypothetical protein [Nocardioides stalactiti]
MRRIVSVFVLAVVAALFSVVAPPQANAAAPIVGRLIDFTTDDPVPGTALRLHANSSGTPGAVVATATTDDTGSFTLTPPSAGDYWVEVIRNNRVQGGYVSEGDGGPSFVQYEFFEAATLISSGTDLGDVWDAPSFISGVVVNAASGNRVRGVTVSYRETDALGVVLGSDVTDANGFFRINNVFGEEFGIRVNGSAKGYENGWVGCHNGVVPTWGAACAGGPGRVGKIRLDKL